MMRIGGSAIAGLLTVLSILVASAAVAQEPPGFRLHEHARPLPDIAFDDQAGASLRLSDFRGKVVLLNLWATWCAPSARDADSRPPASDARRACF
jgi:cytochrome oxidase Cu insertion factor (SCO1/SenC/PrrC family)